MFDPMETDNTPEPVGDPGFEVSFTIEGNPVAKGRPRFTTMPIAGDSRPLARAYTPKRTRTYEQTVAGAAKAAMRGSRPSPLPVQMTLVAFVPIPTSWNKQQRAEALAGLIVPTGAPDLDNYEKAVTDGMNGIIYVDDSQICDVTKSKRYSDRPRVHVRVFALGNLTSAPKRKKKAAKPKGAK